MDYVELKRELPKGLIIPPLSRKEVPDYGDRDTYYGLLTPEGFIKLVNKTEDITIGGPKAFIKAFTKRRHTFIVMSASHMSLLFRGFSDEQKQDLHIYPNLGTGVEGYKIYRSFDLARKISIRGRAGIDGNKWWSMIIFTLPERQLSLSVDPEGVVKEFLELMPKKTGIQPSGVSLAATWREFLFGETIEDGIHEQFQVVRDMNVRNHDTLESYYNSCKRPIMSSSVIGPIGSSRAEDMKRAYLTALFNAPSKSKWDVYHNDEPYYDPDAFYANYYVRVTVPPAFKFTPNNFRAGDDFLGYGTYACTGGPQLQSIGQLRARQWTLLGIPFEVLRAHKILPAGGTRFPWKTRVNMVTTVLDGVQKEFKYLNFQEVYYKALGSLLHIHDEYSPSKGITTKAFSCFDPILMNWIYEFVDIQNWQRLQTNPAYTQIALSIDANTVLDHPDWKPDPTGMFREKGEEGATERFFPNPRNKDANTLIASPNWAAVKEAARRGEKTAQSEATVVVTWAMIAAGKAKPEDEGKRMPIARYINTGGENRLTKDGRAIVQPKDIAEDQLEIHDPSVEELAAMEEVRPLAGDFDSEHR